MSDCKETDAGTDPLKAIKNMVNVVQTRVKFVPGGDDNPIKNLVGIAIDKSEHSRRAFDCNFYTYRVCNKLTDGKIVIAGKWQEATKQSYAQCQELINSYKSLCEENNLSFEIHLGSKQHHKVGTEIITIIQERGIQWLVMGTRGLDSIRRTILGSVSDYLLHHSSVPITVVPPP